MQFAEFSREGLAQHLHDLGVKRGSKIVVHSSLLAFGRIPGKARTVFEVLQQCVGSDGLICVPTFTFGLDPKQPFDPRTQAPIGMGALANYVSGISEARRTPNCIHSYAAVGQGAERLDDVASDRSFGPGSFFELAELENFFWVMLGCPISEGCTLLHHVEAGLGVPYRTAIKLPRRIVLSDGRHEDILYTYHARTDSSIRCDFEPVRETMLREGSMARATAPHGESLAAPTVAIVDCGRRLIGQDPYILVKERAGSRSAP